MYNYTAFIFNNGHSCTLYTYMYMPVGLYMYMYMCMCTCSVYQTISVVHVYSMYCVMYNYVIVIILENCNKFC